MIITEVAVQHFRSIEDATVAFSPVTAFVGANGSGKSNFLHALNFFYSQTTSLLWRGRLRVRKRYSQLYPAYSFQISDLATNEAIFGSRMWCVTRWAHKNDVSLHFIDPGKPNQTPFIESFNRSFRDECLNENWFISLNDARRKIERWRLEYNGFRPHSSLGDQTPKKFANR